MKNPLVRSRTVLVKATTKAPRGTPAIAVIATVALLSSAGGAVAGGLITSAKIKDNTIQSVDVRNGTLKVADISPGAVTTLRGVSDYEFLTKQEPVAAGVAYAITTACPQGKSLLTAAGSWVGSNAAVQVVLGVSSAQIYTDGLPSADTLRIQLICAFVNS